MGQVLEASAERPYLSLRLDLDPALVGSVMVEAGHLSSPNRGDVRAPPPPSSHLHLHVARNRSGVGPCRQRGPVAHLLV